MSVDGLGRRALGPEDTAILIPVRLGGSRFPDKALKLLWGKPLFWWAYRAARQSKVASAVRVVTDSEEVADACHDLPAECHYWPQSKPTGSDRLAAVLQSGAIDFAKIIINLQCDEPQITTTDLTVLARAVWESKSVQVATLATPLSCDRDDRSNPNTVKVLLDQRGRALYFTRAILPEHRKSCLAHVGVYAFRRSVLEAFGRYPRGNLEQAESLEQLRLLEEGIPIQIVEINGRRQAVNSKEDLEWLEQQKSPAII